MPRSLMAVSADGQVTLTWDVASNATGYNVKHVSTAAGSLVVIATNVQEASLVVTNLKNGIANFYTVSSLADGFESADTPRIRVTPSAPVLDLLPAGAKLEKLATGFQFTEGPMWIPAEPGFLIFSDIHDPPFQSSSAMYKWTSGSSTTLFRSATNVANGNTLDREGRYGRVRST
jgi:hypothetical protein